MEAGALKNRNLYHISFENDMYTMVVSLKESFLRDAESYSFLLVNRLTDEERTMEIREVRPSGEFHLLYVGMSTIEYMLQSIEGEVWNVYILRQVDSIPMRTRIRTRDLKLTRHAAVFSGNQKMLYPAATKKGNLSYYVTAYKLFAFIEEIELLKQGQLRFAGHFHFPPLCVDNAYIIKQVRILIKNSLNDEIISLPISFNEGKDSETTDSGKMVKEFGFSGTFDVLPYLELPNQKFFKFYLELEYEQNGFVESIQSSRIKATINKPYKNKLILKPNSEKIQLRIKTTKDSKFLSLSVGKYNFKKEVSTTLKSKWVKFRRSNVLQKVYKKMFKLLGHRPANKKLVMFESFLGKQYSDSPRAIYEYMAEHHSDYRLIWSVDRAYSKMFEEKGIPYVRRFSVQWLFLMTGAKYWVNNSRFPLWIPKPKHTTYLQTWHGTPLKRLAADMEEVHMPGTNTAKYKENFLKEASNWDYLVSPNAYSSEIFARAFQFDRKMIESGYPRNDYLHQANNEKTIQELKTKFNLPEDKKIILYAPTWRDNQFYAKGKYKFDLEMDLNQMRDELGDSYIVIMRMHYLVAENMDLSPYEGFAYDFSHLEDIRELYLISDILMTDYSSVFFDYANLRRPMIFFVYDIEDYRDNLRGFYFNFEEKAPGLLTKTTDGIIAEVKRLEAAGFELDESFEEFYNKFCYLESGESTKRVVDEVFQD